MNSNKPNQKINDEMGKSFYYFRIKILFMGVCIGALIFYKYVKKIFKILWTAIKETE